MTDLLRQLERARPGYDAERDHHAFMLDSYTGGGGYQGAIRQPEAGWWGAAAERYAPWSRFDLPSMRSYLDRYPREDLVKYAERRARAHLWNFVGPLTDLKVGMVLGASFAYSGQPLELGRWREDVDGAGTTWAELRPAVALACAIWGWAPVVVDMDAAAEGESIAYAAARGAGRPRAIPLTPANLVDYSLDGGAFRWAKVRTDHLERDAWTGEERAVARYGVWTSESVQTFEVRRAGGYGEPSAAFVDERPHPFGQVPIAVFRHAPMPGEPLLGRPMHRGPAVAQRRLYNLLSELDEHMRSQVFATLVLARRDTGELTLGTDNALTLDPDARQRHYYLSPNGDVAAAYETRIGATIEEGIYRAARAEFTRPGERRTSGGARALEFAQAAHALGDFAGELARGERWMDAIAWAGLGGRPDALDGYRITPSLDLGEDVQSAIDRVTQALALKLGATVSARLRMRLAQRLDPSMPASVRATVEAEIADLANA